MGWQQGEMKMDIAVVTGGCSGMGLACARHFSKTHRLVLADINLVRLEEAAAELTAAGSSVVPFAVDVTDPAAIANLVKLVESLGRFGMLVHCAGLSPTMADGRRIMEVNLVGTALLERAFLPLVTPGAAAIFIASSAAHMQGFEARDDAVLRQPLSPRFWTRVAPDLATPESAYSTAKRGVILYTKAVAAEWGARGGRVVSLSPGLINTPMGRQEAAGQPIMAKLLEVTALGREGRADEIASVVAFLASNAASFISGTDVLVDGGLVAGLPKLMAAHDRTVSKARGEGISGFGK
jgi:NAD(P)-dependent dehydrogenase (short-subunit alcohol dehydrogenase family)